MYVYGFRAQGFRGEGLGLRVSEGSPAGLLLGGSFRKLGDLILGSL